ncbi:hypothetical protein CCP3SC15_580007 [Gammaproteobacteria bacterium]
MTPGEIVLSLLAGLFALAFGLWARRLDKALDLLEKIQKDTHDWAIATEHRLTTLESFKESCVIYRVKEKD